MMSTPASRTPTAAVGRCAGLDDRVAEQVRRRSVIRAAVLVDDGFHDNFRPFGGNRAERQALFGERATHVEIDRQQDLREPGTVAKPRVVRQPH